MTEFHCAVSHADASIAAAAAQRTEMASSRVPIAHTAPPSISPSACAYQNTLGGASQAVISIRTQYKRYTST